MSRDVQTAQANLHVMARARPAGSDGIRMADVSAMCGTMAPDSKNVRPSSSAPAV
jgi:hypothetical protein